jgi:cytoskeletal protein CcmA (bactofilin family)
MFGSRHTKTTTIVAREAQFEGALELLAGAHIEGSFRGTLTAAGELSIGPEGSVEGRLTARSMVIAGRVQGTVVVHETLRVLRSGKVEGHVYYGSLEVAHGGSVTGQLQHGEPEHTETSQLDAPEQHEEQSGIAPARPRGQELGDHGARAVGER